MELAHILPWRREFTERKFSIKSNEQNGASSHFVMAKRIIKENLTILFKLFKIDL